MYLLFYFFFFNDTATTEIYTLSLHDALPICRIRDAAAAILEGRAVTLETCGDWRFTEVGPDQPPGIAREHLLATGRSHGDRKSTRLNSRHAKISDAVFLLKKKKKQYITNT